MFKNPRIEKKLPSQISLESEKVRDLAVTKILKTVDLNLHS
jgi:hypothetical protein